jgi:uncharacterized protein DUF1838
LNLDNPPDNLRGLLKARASLDGTDVVTWFTGNVHAMAPQGQFRPVFGLEGYNVARAVEAEGGYDLLTREAVFYLDPVTREILERWKNPFNDEGVDVVHIWNDPVNQQMRLEGPRGPWRVPVTGIGDEIYFNFDIFLAYPSPLSRAEFPENSQDDLYQAAELFQFFCSRKQIEDESVQSAACQVSWTRIAPWLPFMKMADRPGQLVYHCRGRKLNGFAELPNWIQDYVEKNGPQFKTAPTEFTTPNETSWTYFKKLAAS